MNDGARQIAVDAGWRLQSIFDVRHLFSHSELIRLYKSLVLSFIESGTPGYYHGSPSALDCIDRVQRRFLRAMRISDVEALTRYNLAPLNVRRDIAILGFLHRINLNLVSDQIKELIPQVGSREPLGNFVASRVRGATCLHNMQLYDRVSATCSEQFKRSIFGMVRCYNSLPQWVVENTSVKAFQRSLQECVKSCARSGLRRWQSIFADGKLYLSLLTFQGLFAR